MVASGNGLLGLNDCYLCYSNCVTLRAGGFDSVVYHNIQSLPAILTKFLFGSVLMLKKHFFNEKRRFLTHSCFPFRKL